MMCVQLSERSLFHWELLFKERLVVLNSVPTGILVKMLKKEKKRAQDAAAQLAKITSGQSLTSQSASSLSTVPLLREGSTDTVSSNHGGRAMQYMKRGTLSFIIFVLVFTKHFFLQIVF